MSSALQTFQENLKHIKRNLQDGQPNFVNFRLSFPWYGLFINLALIDTLSRRIYIKTIIIETQLIDNLDKIQVQLEITLCPQLYVQCV